MVKISELERTVRLFQETEDGMVGICSLEEDEPSSPIDMLNAMKPYGTPQEQEFIDESIEAGDGLLIAGDSRVPVRGKFPKGNVLYDLFSTNPNEVEDKKRMEELFRNETR